MLTVYAIDWNINPLVFLEFFFVVAFWIGWLIVERVAKRYDKPPPVSDEMDGGGTGRSPGPDQT